MQTTSVALYQQLLPGISNVTLRVRYYGLYAWLADWYAQNVGLTDINVWCRYVRRTEALYALAAEHAGNEQGMAGTNWAGQLLQNPGLLIDFSAGTDREEGHPQYLKQKFGAFGAAYGSQLTEIEMLGSAEDHDIPVPTPLLGDAAAAAFGNQAGAAAPLFIAAVQEGRVARADLGAFSVMLPSAIGANGVERQLYESMLFGTTAEPSPRAADRARTLRLILQMAQEHQESVSADLVRWALYAQQRRDGKPLQPLSIELEEHAFRWRVYQANDLLHTCYEALLRYMLDFLEGYPSGLSVGSLMDLLTSRVQKELGWQPQTWRQLVTSVNLSSQPLQAGHDSDLGLAGSVLRANRPMVLTTAETVRQALTLLAVLVRRFEPELPRIRATLPLMQASAYTRSLVSELDFLSTFADEPYERFLQRLLRSRVLDRHLWVASQKLRTQGDYTFLVEADEGRIRLKQKDGPTFTNPRLGPAIRFLEDIHLLGPHGPTAAGQQLLEVA
jgi:hypothetical protein